jgi:hypothetical protein
MASSSGRDARVSRAACESVPAVEQLERRTLMCMDHIRGVAPARKAVELRPDLVASTLQQQKNGWRTTSNQAASLSAVGVNPPLADIVWTNRGSGTGNTDRFFEVFGSAAAADQARAVVDAVIRHFERLIGSFNYGDGSNTFSLSLSMASTGTSLGASASLNTTLGGKPRSGSVTMGRGGTIGTSSAWWIDPTPDDNSEFQGSIQHAFTGDAQSGSPAAGRSDFYTVVSAEVTHALGLYGGLGQVPTWDALTTNTGVADNAEGGGIGNFWVFRGPSVKHLMTGNNGGSGGQNFNGAVHSAGVSAGITFQGDQYIGTNDIGNAVYEFGRRYIPSLPFSLMFKDAYGYSSVDPSIYGTMYASLNQTTGQLLVRGGSSSSADNISVSFANGKVTVSVDVGNDVAGSGALPGPGNLPAFVSEFDLAAVSSVVIQAGDLNDTITVQMPPAGESVSIDAGTGTDTITVDDTAATGAQSYTLTDTSLTRAGAGTLTFSNRENVIVNTGSGDDTVSVTPSTAVTAFTVNTGAGTDQVIVNDAAIATAVNYTLGAGLVDRSTGSDVNYTGAELLRLSATGGANTVTLNAVPPGVTSVELVGNAGGDTFNVTPQAAAVVTVDGGDPTTSPGDTLNLTLSAPSSVAYKVPSLNRFVFADRLPVNYAAIEALPSSTPAPAVGDMNGDGAVNNLDIAPFVQGLTSPSAYLATFAPLPLAYLGDVNNDGAFNNLDIAPFVALLTSVPAVVSSPAAAPRAITGDVLAGDEVGTGSRDEVL